MNISITKRKFLAYLTLITALAGGMGALILHEWLPEYYFGGYPFVPVYFYLYGIFYIYMFDACRRRAPQKMLWLFMGMKVMKLLMSVFMLVIYCVAVPASAIAFLLTFVVFYLGYLVYESWFFFMFEWNKKLKKENRKI